MKKFLFVALISILLLRACGEGETPTAERRVVEVGFSDDLNTQILSGLKVGDTVVIKGQRSLKNGSPLKVLEGAAGVED